MSTTIEMARYRAIFMTNNPVDSSLIHIGDVVELPKFAGDKLATDGVLQPVSDTVALQKVNRGEPNKIIGFNISEDEYLRGERLREAQSEVVLTAPQKGGK